MRRPANLTGSSEIRTRPTETGQGNLGTPPALLLSCRAAQYSLPPEMSLSPRRRRS